MWIFKIIKFSNVADSECSDSENVLLNVPSFVALNVQHHFVKN